MISNKQQECCFSHPFRAQIQNALFGVRPKELLSEQEILQHFRQRAMAALKAYRACRLDRSYLFIYGMECWERKLDSKWFDVCREFKLYVEVRNQMGKPEQKGA